MYRDWNGKNRLTEPHRTENSGHTGSVPKNCVSYYPYRSQFSTWKSLHLQSTTAMWDVVTASSVHCHCFQYKCRFKKIKMPAYISFKLASALFNYVFYKCLSVCLCYDQDSESQRISASLRWRALHICWYDFKTEGLYDKLVYIKFMQWFTIPHTTWPRNTVT